MSPITHLLASWGVATLAPGTTRRERVLITLAGVIPDADGVGAPIDLVTRHLPMEPTRLFHAYHHLLGHNVLFAAVCAVCAVCLLRRDALWRRRLLVLGFVVGAFHLHLLCDVLGARGPDGSQWPIPYLQPFSDAWRWAWSGQWALDGWPNRLITLALLLWAGVVGVRRGYTVIEIFPGGPRLDRIIVETLRRRFSRHSTPVQS